MCSCIWTVIVLVIQCRCQSWVVRVLALAVSRTVLKARELTRHSGAVKVRMLKRVNHPELASLRCAPLRRETPRDDLQEVQKRVDYRSSSPHKRERERERERVSEWVSERERASLMGPFLGVLEEFLIGRIFNHRRERYRKTCRNHAIMLRNALVRKRLKKRFKHQGREDRGEWFIRDCKASGLETGNPGFHELPPPKLTPS